MSTTDQQPSISFILSLIGGIIVLLTSVMNFAWFVSGSPYWGGFGSFMSGMMDGHHNFMGFYGGSYEYLVVFSLVGLVCGVIIVVSAAMLRANPREHVMWGAIIILFSVISFMGMGGFFIGAVLGIIGGAFAVAYRPRMTRTENSSVNA